MLTFRQFVSEQVMYKFWYNLNSKKLLPVEEPDHHGDYAAKHPGHVNISPGVATAIKKQRSQQQRASHPEIMKQNIRITVLRGKTIFLDFADATDRTLEQAQDVLFMLHNKGFQENEVAVAFQKSGYPERFTDHTLKADDILTARHWSDVVRPASRYAAA